MTPRVGIVLSLGALALLSGCGSTTPAAGLNQARSSNGYPLYYLGTSFHGLPLTSAGLGPGSGTGRQRAWSFIYGSCTASSDQGCATPLEVQNWSICSRFPAIYPGPTPQTSTAHGAETLPTGGGLDVYTGHTTVVIFGRDRGAAIRSLTRVSNGATPQKLPRPAPGSLEGKLHCQAPAMQRFSN